jgi:hypothetical protein
MRCSGCGSISGIAGNSIASYSRARNDRLEAPRGRRPRCLLVRLGRGLCRWEIDQPTKPESYVVDTNPSMVINSLEGLVLVISNRNTLLLVIDERLKSAAELMVTP